MYAECSAAPECLHAVLATVEARLHHGSVALVTRWRPRTIAARAASMQSKDEDPIFRHVLLLLHLDLSAPMAGWKSRSRASAIVHVVATSKLHGATWRMHAVLCEFDGRVHDDMHDLSTQSSTRTAPEMAMIRPRTREYRSHRVLSPAAHHRASSATRRTARSELTCTLPVKLGPCLKISASLGHEVVMRRDDQSLSPAHG